MEQRTEPRPTGRMVFVHVMQDDPFLARVTYGLVDDEASHVAHFTDRHDALDFLRVQLADPAGPRADGTPPAQ